MRLFTREADLIERYNRREMRSFIIRGIAHWKPDALRQFVFQSGINMEEFNQLTEQLLEVACSRFARHSLRWLPYYPTPNPSILTRMIHYDFAWEGFPSDEPWFNSRNQKIRYFFDIKYEVRIQEMLAIFYN